MTPRTDIQDLLDHLAERTRAIERSGVLPAEIVADLAHADLLASHIPTEFGGQSLDMTAYGEIHAQLGRLSSSLRSLLTVHDMVAEAVHRLGSDEQKLDWLPKLASGDEIGAFALTEPGAGSDAAAIETRAEPTTNGFRLTGHKRWITFGQMATVFLVMAKIEGDGPVVGFLVPATTTGLTRSPVEGMLGLRAAMLADVDLDGCIVPAESRVGPERMPGDLVVGTALHHGRYSVAWGCLGIGEACHDASLEYSQRRVQFGEPLAEHQLIRRMLTNMITDTRAARLLCESAGELWDQRDREAIQATLIAKYFASGMASRVANDAIQVHGARGASSEYPIEQHFRDARVMEIIEGSNEIQQLLIANYGLRAPKPPADT
ncbi:MAG: acyl-CoA dehydrogenase family protein [Acidimicrobiales bacterium]